MAGALRGPADGTFPNRKPGLSKYSGTEAPPNSSQLLPQPQALHTGGPQEDFVTVV